MDFICPNEKILFCHKTKIRREIPCVGDTGISAYNGIYMAGNESPILLDGLRTIFLNSYSANFSINKLKIWKSICLKCAWKMLLVLFSTDIRVARTEENSKAFPASRPNINYYSCWGKSEIGVFLFLEELSINRR